MASLDHPFFIFMAGYGLAFLSLVYFAMILTERYLYRRLVDKMGVLDSFMATPANHRVHHGRNPRYIDKNYGQVLVIWDRIFGTFEPETEAPDFGLVEPMTSNNPVRIWAGGWIWLAARLRSAPDLKTKIQYLYMPPEWSHDGCLSGCAKSRTNSRNTTASLDPAE